MLHPSSFVACALCLSFFLSYIMMDWLPTEVAEDIAGCVAEQSYAPMDDLASLRATCLDMRRVCGTAEVGQHIPLHWVLQHQGFLEPYYYDIDYRALLTTRLARVGNLETCFLADLRPVFMEARRSLTLLMEWLQHSTKAGYKLGMHVYAIVLYRSNTGGGNDDIARRLLRELEGADEVGPAALPWAGCTTVEEPDLYAVPPRRVLAVVGHGAT
jgi:hypothetical protein